MAHAIPLAVRLSSKNWLQDLFTVIGASVLIALFAPLSFKLPFSPVPIATQLHCVLFLAAVLGSKRASFAVLAYLFYGALGLPVFATGGSGLAWLCGPTGGYLFGYLFAAYVTGTVVERAAERSVGTFALALALGHVPVFILGSLWLSLFVGSLTAALTLGVLPFLVGDALKTVLVLKALKSFCARAG